MKNVLITGAYGYVGGRLVEHLKSTGDYNLFLTSRKEKEDENSYVYSLDSKDNLFEKINQPIDILIHLASINEVVCANDPLKAVELNTLGSFRLIQDAKAAGVKRIVYLSTAHVYGAPLKGLITEENLTRPTHPYAYSHRAVEDYIAELHDKFDMDGIVVRLSNSLGAPVSKDVDRWMLLVSDLCIQAVREQKLVLKSAGLQKRDFIGLSDAVRGIEHLMNLESLKLGDGIFNLGGECSESVLNMAKLIQKRCETVLDFKPELVVPEGDQTSENLTYSIQKLKNTGFKLENTIEQEIDSLLKFCQQYMK